MSRAVAIRKQVEAVLSSRVSGALSPQPHPEAERFASGIPGMDILLRGGIPVGTVSEFVGMDGSGRTSIALAYLSTVTMTGNVCAWIDVADVLDPESAAANGVNLERLLWVRCGMSSVQEDTPPETMARDFQDNCEAEFVRSQPRHTGGGSPHPRSEGRDMPQAISSLLQAHGGLYDKQLRREKKSIGTPGAPNRKLSVRSEEREEQVNSDRLPPRRGDNLAVAPQNSVRRCAGPQSQRVSNVASGMSVWTRLDQALRVTDLILQGGGFGAIVLDLGSVPPEIAWRIPLATWFRFRAACERSGVSLILLTQHPCARSSAELVVRLQPGSMEGQGKVMTGIRYRASVERSRSHERERHTIQIRKPPQPERPGEWISGGLWA